MRKSQYIGLTVLALAVLFVIYKVRGQSFGNLNHDQPYLVGPVPINTSSTNFECSSQLILHLIASDLTYTGAVGAWTDRVNGIVFQQPTGGAQPIKTNGGILFDGSSDYLEATNAGLFTLWNHAVYYMAVRPELYGQYEAIMGRSDNGDGVDLDYSELIWESSSTLNVSGKGIPDKKISSLYFFGQASPQSLAFTNGVYTYNLPSGANTVDIKRIGAANPLSGNTGLRHFYKGYIYEIKVWTNCIANQPSATNYAQLIHSYTTNTYIEP